jgi:hypothetical protein
MASVVLKSLSEITDHVPEDSTYVVCVRQDDGWHIGWSEDRPKIHAPNWVQFKLQCEENGVSWRLCEWVRS